jgi:hypothetical protein
MKIIFMDYSERYYADVAGTALPEVRGGKFVQIRTRDSEYILLSPKEITPYHADLVQKFCLEKGIDGSYDIERKRFNIAGTEWVVAGGGKFEINDVQRYIYFYDDSMAYGKFDSKGLEGKVHQIVGLSDYEVRTS